MLTEVEEADGRSGPRLQPSIMKIREAMADRQDAFEDLRDKERVLLIALERELQALADDVPKEDDWVLLTMSAGEKPRYWVDATSHVAIGRDRRTYRFLRDTRLGRIVICESENVATVAQSIADYLAERIIERERAIDGDWLAAVQSRYDAAAEAREAAARAEAATETETDALPPAVPEKRRSGGLGTYFLGFVTGLVLMFGVWAYSDPGLLDPVKDFVGSAVRQTAPDQGE